MNQCDGCRFRGTGSKRCNACSRKYLDRFEAPKKMTEAERERAKEAIAAFGLMNAVIAQSGNPYLRR